MKAEIERRQSHTQRLIKLFRSRPLQWIAWTELGEVGGNLAWRTRVADARKILKADGGRVEWNKNVRDSRYRFVPYVPLGPSADTKRDQLSMF